MKYLRQDVAFEPLICRWYAWPLLVSPATLALIAKNRLLPLLESYVDDPDFHRKSARDPALRGGSFVNHDGDVAQAEALLDEMQDQLDPQLLFADALLLANDLLLRDGDGSSLEPLYARMPKPLRGLVELGYDLNNHATLRLIEPLLYASELYDPGTAVGAAASHRRRGSPFHPDHAPHRSLGRRAAQGALRRAAV
jgi:hypothetical protein